MVCRYRMACPHRMAAQKSASFLRAGSTCGLLSQSHTRFKELVVSLDLKFVSELAATRYEIRNRGHECVSGISRARCKITSRGWTAAGKMIQYFKEHKEPIGRERR